MEKRWKILQADTGKAAVLQESLKINHALCAILSERGFDSFDKAKNYFRPQLTDLHDPWLMKDMDKAIQRILMAFEKKEKISNLCICSFRVNCSKTYKNEDDFLKKIKN